MTNHEITWGRIWFALLVGWHVGKVAYAWALKVPPGCGGHLYVCYSESVLEPGAGLIVAGPGYAQAEQNTATK